MNDDPPTRWDGKAMGRFMRWYTYRWISQSRTHTLIPHLFPEPITRNPCSTQRQGWFIEFTTMCSEWSKLNRWGLQTEPYRQVRHLYPGFYTVRYTFRTQWKKVDQNDTTKIPKEEQTRCWSSRQHRWTHTKKQQHAQYTPGPSYVPYGSRAIRNCFYLSPARQLWVRGAFSKRKNGWSLILTSGHRHSMRSYTLLLSYFSPNTSFLQIRIGQFPVQ